MDNAKIATKVDEGYNGGNGSSSEDLTSIYRAVGPEEYFDLFDVKKFRPGPKSAKVKYFGLDFDETLKFADWTPDASAIIEVKIPDSVLKDIGDFTPLDTPIFKHGTVTIPGDQLDIFNKYITDILHVF